MSPTATHGPSELQQLPGDSLHTFSEAANYVELKLGCTKRIKAACISGIISAPWCNSDDHLIACKKLLVSRHIGHEDTLGPQCFDQHWVI